MMKTSTLKTKSTKSVTFASSNCNNVMEIESISCWSDDEIQSSWWTMQEYKTIQKSICATLSIMEKYNGETEYCSFRGLENFTPIGKRYHQRTVQSLVQFVLSQQQQQQQQQNYVDNDIKKLSSCCFDTNSFASMNKIAFLTCQQTAPSVTKAHLRALQDAQDVQDIMMDNTVATTATMTITTTTPNNKRRRRHESNNNNYIKFTKLRQDIFIPKSQIHHCHHRHQQQQHTSTICARQA